MEMCSVYACLSIESNLAWILYLEMCKIFRIADTVNTASRIESSGEVCKVNISESTYELVKDQFACTYPGEIEAKVKGKVKMYFVG